MTEWHFGQDFVSTFTYHEHRARAPHLEQPVHRPRLLKAVELIREVNPSSVVDLGCGDGGLLSEIKGIDSWGYDFAPANAVGWAERGVRAEARDVFNDRDVPRWGELAVLTEVLEHLADPHGTLEWVAENATFVVASSPRFETDEFHEDCHTWAWDWDGYEALLSPHFEILRHVPEEWSQLIVGRSKIS